MMQVRTPKIPKDPRFGPVSYTHLDVYKRQAQSPTRTPMLRQVPAIMDMAASTLVQLRVPVPHRDMLPVSMEEQVICFADKFYSKTHLEQEKSVEKARKSLQRYGCLLYTSRCV